MPDYIIYAWPHRQPGETVREAIASLEQARILARAYTIRTGVPTEIAANGRHVEYYVWSPRTNSARKE